MAKPDIADFAARIAKVHARQQVHYTINRCTRALDYAAPADFADCFAPDARYEGMVPDGSVQRCSGIAELYRFAAEFKWPAGMMRHWLTGTDVELGVDTATATSLKGAIGAGPDGPHLRMVGRNTETLVESPDGRWRFASRLSEIIARRAPPVAPK